MSRAVSVAVFLLAILVSILIVRPWLQTLQGWLNDRLAQLPSSALVIALFLPSIIVIGYTLSVWGRSKLRERS